MDDGEVIVGLDESWSLGGAKASEWGSGFVALIIGSEMIPKGHFTSYLPVLLAAWIATTFGLAAVRKMFPDEEKGVRNAFAAAIGIPPPGIPAPASLQPVWSGAPLRTLPERAEMVTQKLDEVYAIRLQAMLEITDEELAELDESTSDVVAKRKKRRKGADR